MKTKILLIILLLLTLSINIFARYYNPDTGRFTATDTVTPGGGYDSQGLNRYSYCANNPVKYVDPTGHADNNSQNLWNYDSSNADLFTSTFPTYSRNIFNWGTQSMDTQNFNLGHFITTDPGTKRFLGLMALTTGLATGGVGFWPALLIEDSYIFGSRVAMDNKFDEETFKIATFEACTYLTLNATLQGGANLLGKGSKLFPENGTMIDSKNIFNLQPVKVGNYLIIGRSYYNSETKTFSQVFINIRSINTIEGTNFLKVLEDEARQYGAKKIIIEGQQIENSGLLISRLYTKKGYKIEEMIPQNESNNFKGKVIVSKDLKNK